MDSGCLTLKCSLAGRGKGQELTLLWAWLMQVLKMVSQVGSHFLEPVMMVLTEPCQRDRSQQG